MLKLGFDVGRAGDTFPTVYNAANEVAVAAFLAKRITYLEIEKIVQWAVDRHQSHKVSDLNILIEADKETRLCVENRLRRM